jgi:hypothetical protein
MVKCYWSDCDKESAYKIKGDESIAYCPFHAIYVSILLGDYRKAFKVYGIEKKAMRKVQPIEQIKEQVEAQKAVESA